MARHFFALWPTEDASQRLAALAHAVAERTGGRAVPPANLHLTLAFLGELDDGRAAAAKEVAAAIRGGSFSLTLARLGAFRRARVAWITDPAPAEAFLALQAELEMGLRAAGFALEARPFNPHVTLARHIEAQQETQPTEAIAWRVTDFALMRSDAASGRYLSLASWGLGP